MNKYFNFVFVILLLSACSHQSISRTSQYSELSLQPKIENINQYPCSEMTLKQLQYFLDKSELIDVAELHDHYSTVGCIQTGTVNVNGVNTKFSVDHGVIMTFESGEILACGQTCCTSSFTYCSWYDSNKSL